MSTEGPSVPRATSGGVQGLIKRFWGFDELIGSVMIKFLYYAGLIGIAIGVLIGLMRGFDAMGYSATLGLGLIVASILGGAVGLILWRFVCELYLLAYLFYNRLGEVRDRLPPR